MTNEEIVERIAQGEDSRTQFKLGPVGVAKLAAELAAFSNAGGGVILFGVGDSGEVVGLDAAAKKLLNDELSNAANDNVRPSVYPQTEYHTIEGRQILCVTVAEGVSKPYADKSGNYWMKSGPDKRRITAREELQRILQKSHLLHADEVPVYGTSTKDIDLYHLGEFLERNYGISAEDVLEPGKVDIPQKLRNLGFAEDSQLTLAGLMLFGKNPQRYLRTNVVKCVSFYGNSIAGTKYRDSEDYSGTIRDLYNKTMQFILRNIHHRQGNQGFNSIGIPEVPEEALQEIVANMLLHRDYFTASPWKVLIFDDRIEIVSPGSLPNHLTIDKIKAGVSVARNPVLFTFATKEIPYRGLGSGVKRILEIVKDIEFKSDDELNLFTVIVKRNKGRETVNETVNSEIGGVNVEDGPVNGPVNVPDGSVNVPVNGSNVPVNDRHVPVNVPVNDGNVLVNDSLCEKIVELVAVNPGINRVEIASRLGVTVRTIGRLVTELQGRIEFRGAPKNGGYYIIESTELLERLSAEGRVPV